MRTLVLPDLHGRVEVLVGILERAGPFDAIVSVGDAIHGGRETGDRDMELLDRLLDMDGLLDKRIEVVVGNHELPYLGGTAFAGWDPRSPVGPVLQRLDEEGVIVPCALVDGYLITHAGVGPHLGYVTAESAFKGLSKLWRNRPAHTSVRLSQYRPVDDDYARTFLMVGRRRGGWEPFGGVTWRDDHEPLADFPQVYGHTPGEAVQYHAWGVGVEQDVGADLGVCIDLGVGLQSGRYAWATIEDGVLEVKEHG